MVLRWGRRKGCAKGSLHASELKRLYRVKKSPHLVSQDGNDNDNDDDVDDDDDGGGGGGGDDGSDDDDDNSNDNDDKIDNNNIGYSFTRSCCGTGSKLLSS